MFILNVVRFVCLRIFIDNIKEIKLSRLFFSCLDVVIIVFDLIVWYKSVWEEDDVLDFSKVIIGNFRNIYCKKI